MTVELNKLRRRIKGCEERLHNHVTIPSWWNRRTDARLKAIEEHLGLTPPPKEDFQ